MEVLGRQSIECDPTACRTRTDPLDSLNVPHDTPLMTRPDHLAVRVPASAESLATMRHALARSLREASWGGEPVTRVITAAGEAMMNAVEHGSGRDATVELEYTVAPDCVHLRVRDDGVPGALCPRTAPTAPPAVSSTRGRGLAMIYALADRVEVRPAGSGTEVILRFDRHSDGGEIGWGA